MIKISLSSRHRIRNSSPGGLRQSTLPLGHGGSPQYGLSHVDGEETFFVSFKPPRPGTEPRTLAWKAAVLATTLGPPPSKATSKHDTLTQCCLNVGPAIFVNIVFLPRWPCAEHQVRHMVILYLISIHHLQFYITPCLNLKLLLSVILINTILWKNS